MIVTSWWCRLLAHRWAYREHCNERRHGFWRDCQRCGRRETLGVRRCGAGCEVARSRRNGEDPVCVVLTNYPLDRFA